MKKDLSVAAPSGIFKGGVSLKAHPGGIFSYRLGDKTVYDLSHSISGRYEDKNLRNGDIVILDRKKFYEIKKKVMSAATFIRLDKKEILALKNEAIKHGYIINKKYFK